MKWYLGKGYLLELEGLAEVERKSFQEGALVTGMGYL
jgi:uncharacterized protein YodC (DUF2158 family)